MENLKNSIFRQLEEIGEKSVSDLVEVHNTHCKLIDLEDATIHRNDFKGLRLLFGESEDFMDIICGVFYGDYNPNHKYVRFDGYGNLESFNNPNDYIERTDIVETMMGHLKEFEGLLDLDY